MKKLLTYLFLFLFLASCVRKTDWPLQTGSMAPFIVDATIVDTLGSQEVKLTKPVAGLNRPPEPFTGAAVLISDEDSSYQLNESPLGSGIYLTKNTFIARLGKNYTLLISKGSDVYTAKAYMVQGSEFPALQYAKNDDDDLYHISYVASAFGTDKPAMWEVLADWSKVPGYEQADPSSCRTRQLFYTLPTLDVSEIFAPKVESISFPAGTILTERRYSLTPEHAEFIRALISETNWQGGLFSSEAAQVMTNVSNGAAGYFSACAMTSLSLTVNP